jgi:virulence-associated protein VapD
MEDGRIQGQVHGQEILIDHVLIYEQFQISNEGVVDVINATFDETKIALKKIAGPHAFVENEQWSVVYMKEEFHAKFAAILQIIYQQKRLAYFNNTIAITFYLGNKGQFLNWCSIVLIQLLVEFTC